MKKFKNVLRRITVIALACVLSLGLVIPAIPVKAETGNGTYNSTQLELLGLSGQDDSLPKVVSYTAYTDHEEINGTDQQFLNVEITYDGSITISDASELFSSLKFSFGGRNLISTASVQVIGGNTLLLTSPIMAGIDGKLIITTIDGSKTISSITGNEGEAVNLPDLIFNVSNGVQLITDSQTAGTTERAASVTKTVIIPGSATRGMIHFAFLKNGMPVEGTNEYGFENFTVHFHNYLTIDAPTFAADYIVGAFNNAFGTDYTATADGDKVTITANTAGEGVLDLVVFGYPRDRVVAADKDALEAKITEAENLTSEDFTAENYAALLNQIAVAKSILNGSYYLQSEVDAALDNLSAAISAKDTTDNGGDSDSAPVDKIPTDELLEDIANNPGGTLTVTLTNPDTVASSVFEAAKLNGTNVVFSILDENNVLKYEWIFKGGNINKTDLNINLALEINTTLPDQIKNKLSEGQKALLIDFAHHGVLPGTTDIKLAVGDSYADGDKLYLYYYNEETGKMEYVAEGLTVADGYVTISIDHCSSYVLTTEKLVTQNVSLTGGSPSTGDTANGSVVAMVMLLSLAGIGWSVKRRKA